ncbi:hypothetical protein MAR_002037 [Mya arenaria]|uniref:Uncharacterized protein n=1 Tax=Mya arenaria TaxID=6604 RepID=A0ABY7FGA2_MYAAR|nr:hypothetical protein MAR_002037 [Mya arenaria]
MFKNVSLSLDFELLDAVDKRINLIQNKKRVEKWMSREITRTICCIWGSHFNCTLYRSGTQRALYSPVELRARYFLLQCTVLLYGELVHSFHLVQFSDTEGISIILYQTRILAVAPYLPISRLMGNIRYIKSNIFLHSFLAHWQSHRIYQYPDSWETSDI